MAGVKFAAIDDNVEEGVALPRASDDHEASSKKSALLHTSGNSSHHYGSEGRFASEGVSVPRVSNSREIGHQVSAKSQKTSRHGFFGGRLVSSDWYHSLLAERLRTIVSCKPFTCLMVLALLTALLLPDMYTIMSVNSNLSKDVALSMVMLVFAFEFVSLTLVDATYVMSFFWYMDIVGTLSMIFDISFILGADITVARTSEGSSAKKNLMLLRAARAARIGARAGRLSRVLRLLKFLPCFKQDEAKKVNRGIAVVISNQLANSVATRVACLTIMLVMVIPLFDVMSFPQDDYSLQTWVSRLSVSYKRKSASGFHREIDQMIDFFKDDNYGPYTACHGRQTDDGAFVCMDGMPYWHPYLAEPRRLGSALLVHSDSFMVGFNMEGPLKFEARLAILNIVFIVFAMVGSGMALSSVVTDLAVRPLERMLTTVRQIASTVFRFSKDVADDDEEEAQQEEDDQYDDDGTSEMELLERVVQKLAVVAELQTKNSMDRTEDMRDEDIGILTMMQGSVGGNVMRTSVSHSSSMTRASQEQSIQTLQSVQARRKVMVPSKALEDLGVSAEVYQSLAFNIIPLSKSQKLSVVFFTIANFHAPGSGYVRTADEKGTLKKFISAAEKEYNANPFHNLAHATDCLHMVARLLRKTSSDEFLSPLEQFALLIAGISHDLGHPGVNNGFLSEVGHELALQYNDRSPLENMHCAKLYTIVSEDETNVFAKLTRDEYREVRKIAIETILHTDMIIHSAAIKDLQMAYQMNSEIFAASEDPDDLEARQAELEVFCQSDMKVMIMNTMLHSADVSNPCRSWETTQGWAFKVIDEFFAQGDEERRLGIPVQFLNDRYKLNKPNSQLGFIEFMIAPFYFAQIRLWPTLAELGDELIENMALWEKMWISEVGPSDEELLKVRARVERVTENLQESKRRPRGA